MASSRSLTALALAAGIAGSGLARAQTTRPESGVREDAATASIPSVRTLYVVPQDRSFRSDYATEIRKALLDLRLWYQGQLGGKTFSLHTLDPEMCQLPRDAAYYASDSWTKVFNDVQGCAPVSYDSANTVWVLYVDVVHACNAPGRLGAGTPGLTMLPRQDLEGLIGNPYYDECGSVFHSPPSRYVGGLGHEIGHAFGLRHPPDCDAGLQSCDWGALMFAGYGAYPATYLLPEDKQRLLASRFFGASDSTVTLDKKALTFTGVSNGASFAVQTPAQTVRLIQTGGSVATWSASSTAPWLVVSPAYGSGSATLTVSTQFASGLGAAQTGRITLTVAGTSSTVGPIEVTLKVVSSTAAVSAPFGAFDTPVGDATALAGSIAVTGWTLDDVGVKRVEIWRDLQAGETTPPFAGTPSDPRNGRVFIANAGFVDGARPDVEALNPATPLAYRGGWGYLLLTWGLWNQGNGSYRLHVFAFDEEGNVSTIGSKTIIVSNNTATKPFGSIDTPAIGGNAAGANFGWALTPRVDGAATCRIGPSGVQVSIDSGPLQPVVYGDVRSDIAAAFAGFANTEAAGGHFTFDWSSLSAGPHTIGWLVTDTCNRADGIGSRFFNVTATASLTIGVDSADSSSVRSPAPNALRVTEADSDAPITLARGFGELPQLVSASETGERMVAVEQGGRVEIRVPRGFGAAYQLVTGGQRRALPIGSTWDAASGTFYWQPAVGFLGPFRIAFSSGTERISVRIIVVPLTTDFRREAGSRN